MFVQNPVVTHDTLLNCDITLPVLFFNVMLIFFAIFYIIKIRLSIPERTINLWKTCRKEGSSLTLTHHPFSKRMRRTSLTASRLLSSEERQLWSEIQVEDPQARSFQFFQIKTVLGVLDRDVSRLHEALENKHLIMKQIQLPWRNARERVLMRAKSELKCIDNSE
ncbi:hypothetical protein PRIPAC_79096 [Pristionchus pacificus]|uniref:Uncharacterized protein n=1 Tax=Pristionchus pacificus TaxID=54126 RepID=A0A2A6CQK3_PRIPA|nr:hypothetical protein PRIPAC_79096 [Pristionchus pacificus]|eukprot:PDM80400.1 hypothetical protein PRIPAC_32979 [Pristionchus pacificus]